MGNPGYGPLVELPDGTILNAPHLANGSEQADKVIRLDIAGGDGSKSARAELAAFVNGRTGAQNPAQQGFNSALLDGLDSLNVIARPPNQGRYSPLWDVHLTQWRPAAAANGQNLLQKDFGDILGLTKQGLVTTPGGAKFGPAGCIVNCSWSARKNSRQAQARPFHTTA